MSLISLKEQILLLIKTEGEDAFFREVRNLRKQKKIRGLNYKRLRIPREWVRKAYEKQLGICLRCEKEMPYKGLKTGEIVGDHIVALAQGGEHTQRNIRALCKGCNSEKSSNSLSREAKLTGRTILEQLQR